MIGPYYSLPCIGLDAADKKLILFLPQIKALVTLVSTISNTCISRRKYLAYQWPFSVLTFSEEYLSRNTPVQIETDMDLCFPGPLSVVGPIEGFQVPDDDSAKRATPVFAVVQRRT